RKIDKLSSNFIYLLSSNSTTGSKLQVQENAEAYFKRVREMKLNQPLVIGFGIHNQETFEKATRYAQGAIIGSAFVKILGQANYQDEISNFIQSIREKHRG
ncbi:MAG: tryptophan synthase subunit alpha, partial [Sphingobacterium sp.]